jgi:hypothetical protein
MITQSLKHNEEMFLMLFLTLRKDQDVINEDHDKLVQLFHETEFIKYMKWEGALVRPKDITRYSSQNLGVGRNQSQESAPGTPIEKRKIKISGTEEISGAMSSLSFSTQATKIDMMPCSQDWEGIIFQWWKLWGEDELQCMTNDVMRTIGQKKAGGYMRVNASSQDVLEHCRIRKRLHRLCLGNSNGSRFECD